MSNSKSNPQYDFETALFGTGGFHPSPKSLPYPTQTLKTLYGDTIEYLIPAGQKEKVLRRLYPFGEPPSLSDRRKDIHEDKEFVVRDFKVVQQGDYVLLVSPYFASSGGSVVDWEPLEGADEGFLIEPMRDETGEAAYSAGFADGMMGLPEGASMPARPEGLPDDRWERIELDYEDGFCCGVEERLEGQKVGTLGSI